MRRLTIMAKGNADVRDSLHALFEDGAVSWNGINAWLREHGDDRSIRVLHEIGVRSDLLLASPRAVPPPLASRALPLGVWTAAAQCGTKLFEAAHDAVILSIQPDVMQRPVRHRGDGHLLYPHDLERWPADDRRWLADAYAPEPPLTPAQSMDHLDAVIARLRRERHVPILILNLSPILPWERIHSYHGLEETLGERIRRFNLALIELSRAADISIVDVEALVARGGVESMKRDAVTLTAAGCRAVAGEVVRILDALGCLDRAAA